MLDTHDNDLIGQVVSGDESAFLALYDRYSNHVYALTLRILHDPMLAEEVTQDTFLKLWSRARQFLSERGSLLNWLLTIARRCALDRVRLEARRPTLSDGIPPEEIWQNISEPDSVTDENRWRTMHFAVGSLTPEHKMVIELAYYQGLSQSEIAEILGWPLGTVKTRLRAAMEQLRHSWGGKVNPKSLLVTYCLLEYEYMPKVECAPFRENIPAFALGALDMEDTAELENHLRTCDDCQEELAAYITVSDGLLISTPPRTPPAALRRRLQGRLPSSQKNSRLRWAWSFNQFALAVMIILLFGLNIFSFFQIQSLQRQQAQFARQINTGQAALAMLSYSGTQTIPITGGDIAGTILLDKDRNVAVLIVWNMPSLTADQTYQIWLIDPTGKRTSAGLFRPEIDQPFTSAAVFSGQNLSNFNGIGVTVEPAVGSSQPTGKRVFKVDF